MEQSMRNDDSGVRGFPLGAEPMAESLMGTLSRWRYTWWPDHLLGELLAKRWMETAIPLVVLCAVAIQFSLVIPGFLSPASLSDTGRQMGEVGFIVLGMALVMIVGGIDLSVGSVFALTNLCALYLMHVMKLPTALTILGTVVFGGILGSLNGILIGYFRLRAFLTTLISLIVYRAFYDLLIHDYAAEIISNQPDSVAWEFVGNGEWFGVPAVVYAYLVVAVFGHIFLTRLRPGWHVTAIGGSRRAAYNTGIALRSTVMWCYAASGALTALGGVFFASRLATAGAGIGEGLELTVITAAVLGGISLGGGKGSVMKALIGTMIVLLIVNGLTALSMEGGYNRMVLAGVLVLAAVVDIRWLKNRHKIVSRVYVSPTYHAMPPPPSTAPDCGTAWALNDRLRPATPIGLGRIEGPEDIILDRNDNLYAGSRHGDIIRFFAPDYERMEVFAHIGGMPLGMAFDRNDNLYVCIGGMGLYRITPEREVQKVTDETNRSYSSINDDSRLRLADDLDISDDGRIFFSEATVRFEMHDWVTDALEARGNGRIICFDTKTGKTHTVIRNLKFPNGVCMASDGISFLFAETWNCSVKRHWFDGPKKGTTEIVLENMPGFPDNINNSSDGNYWMSLVGMRNPALDLAWKIPGFRQRMVKRIPADEWLFPNINTGCVLKFSEKGEVLETLWDMGGKNHPMITSMREHRGYLYLGGISNNRIGRLKLEGADPDYIQYDRRWGKSK